MNDLDHVDTQELERPPRRSHGDVTLHIERLVLDGFAYSLHERGQLQEAIQRELTALLLEGGLEALSGGMTPALRAEAIQISPATRPTQVGSMVAGSVFNSLSQKS